MKLLLDSGVLGYVCHPRNHEDTRAWFARAVGSHDVLMSDVCWYELRRKLVHIGSTSLARLDELRGVLRCVPVSEATWLLASELWAEQRRRGRSGADPEALDADLLIAAQALSEGATVVTTNVRHFAGIVDACTWEEVDPEASPSADAAGKVVRMFDVRLRRLADEGDGIARLLIEPGGAKLRNQFRLLAYTQLAAGSTSVDDLRETLRMSRSEMILRLAKELRDHVAPGTDVTTIDFDAIARFSLDLFIESVAEALDYSAR